MQIITYLANVQGIWVNLISVNHMAAPCEFTITEFLLASLHFVVVEMVSQV